MTIIVSIPSQQYTPRTINLTPTIPAGTKSLVLTCTRETWPVGPVGSINVNYPDGSFGAGVTFDGGEQIGKDGNPVLRTGLRMAGTAGADMPAGVYAVTVGIVQTITTSVVVERF